MTREELVTKFAIEMTAAQMSDNDEAMWNVVNKLIDDAHAAGFRAGIEAAIVVVDRQRPWNARGGNKRTGETVNYLIDAIRALLPAEGKENPRGD